MSDEVLASVKASATRRWMGVGMLAAIGGIVIYVAFATPPDTLWQIFLLATGAGALWMADAMRRATEHGIELTRKELRDTSGVCLARVDDIRVVERGFLAFKPSNGFLIRTKTAGSRRWRPGMWWRLGRQIGVGGVTPASQTKPMSEILSAMLAERDL